MSKAKKTNSRLQPKPETLREIFLKSGNYCAFPDCKELMMNTEGVFIGQVCHIEAAEEGGERFNPNMTPEERRQFSNLLLMCYPHHKITNDVGVYTVAKLKKIKATHEKKFTEPGKAIYQRLSDLTSNDQPTVPLNLGKLESSIDFSLSTEERDQILTALIQYIQKFNTVPHEVRHFLGKVAQRREKMQKSGVVQGQSILITDIQDALGLSPTKAKNLILKLEDYSLGFIQEMSGPNGTIVYGISISELDDGSDIWGLIAEFCVNESIEIETFTDHLNFGQLSN